MSEQRLHAEKTRELSEEELRETEGGVESDVVIVEELSVVRPRGGTRWNIEDGKIDRA